MALYRAEGAKDKPHRRTEVLQFINSDPNVITLFLRRLEFLGVQRERLTLRVSIHESADVEAAERFWAGVAGVDTSALGRATLKRQSADLYRRMEGAWYGIVGAATRQPD